MSIGISPIGTRSPHHPQESNDHPPYVPLESREAYRWGQLLKLPASKELVPEQDLVVSQDRIVLLRNQAPTVFRNVVVIGSRLMVCPEKGSYTVWPHFICDAIFVIGGEFEIQCVKVTACYRIAMTYLQFSKTIQKICKKKGALSPFDRSEVRPTHSARQMFCLTSDINAPNDTGFTALMAAARAGDHEVTELLLKAKANPDLVNKEGWSALKFAALSNSPKVIELLAAFNAKLELRDPSQSTALISACAYNHAKAARELVRAGANIHPENKFGRTPLSAAAKAGTVGVVKLLIESRANINELPDPGYISPKVIYAVITNRRRLLEAITNLDPNATNDANQTPLLLAARYGHRDIASLLIEKKANIEAHILRETSFLRAVREGHISVVELLIDKKANIHVEDYKGDAITSATKKSDMAMLKLLTNAKNQ